MRAPNLHSKSVGPVPGHEWSLLGLQDVCGGSYILTACKDQDFDALPKVMGEPTGLRAQTLGSSLGTSSRYRCHVQHCRWRPVVRSAGLAAAVS